MQPRSAWFHHVLAQAQLLLNFINHTTTTCVYADMLERQLEVWDVGFHAFDPQQLARDEVCSKQQLLTERQYQGPQGGDVSFQAFTCTMQPRQQESRDCLSSSYAAYAAKAPNRTQRVLSLHNGVINVGLFC